MKTPIQQLIEVLKIHRDTAFEKAEKFKDQDVEGMYQWYDYRGQTLNDTISFAELELEKEKEVMVDFAYKFGDEPLAEIAKWYDKQFNK